MAPANCAIPSDSASNQMTTHNTYKIKLIAVEAINDFMMVSRLPISAELKNKIAIHKNISTNQVSVSIPLRPQSRLAASDLPQSLSYGLQKELPALGVTGDDVRPSVTTSPKLPFSWMTAVWSKCSFSYTSYLRNDGVVDRHSPTRCVSVK